MKKQPELLKLTQDLVFKTFFSRNKQVLLSLLRSFLPISDTISDVTILNPEERDQLHIVDSNIPPDVEGGKLVVLDLRVKLISGENINVEMQTFPQSDFRERILYYWIRLCSQGLKEGEKYKRVHPTYSLIFTTFTVLGKEIDYINDCSIRVNKPPHNLFSDTLNIVVVELNKFKKECTELLELRDMWCYLLKNSSQLTVKEYEYLLQHEEMEMALEHLNEISEDTRLFHEALTREMTERDHMKRLTDAREEGIAEGRAEGRAEGMEEGRAEGMEEGRAEGMEEGMETVALRMLKDGFELPMISKMTGLSEEKIKQLK